MDEEIDTRTADGFLSAFAPTAREDFERRMDRIARYLADIEAHPIAFSAFGRLVAMDDAVRAATLGQVVDDASGPATLGGVESIILFLNAHALLGRACHAVPFVPSDHLQAIFDGHASASSRNSPEGRLERKRVWLAEQARFAEIREGADAEGRSLAPAGILACVERNARIHAELAEARALAMRRVRDGRAVRVPASSTVPTGLPSPLREG